MPIRGAKSSNSVSNSSTTFISCGTTIKPTITYNIGEGTATIGTGTYRLFHTENYTGLITEHTIAETTLSIPEHTIIYICVSYNNGNPIINALTDFSELNGSNICPVYTVTRDGDNLSYIDWDSPGNGLANKIHTRLTQADRFARVSGLNLGEEATRSIIVSSGIIWQGVYRNSMQSVDSSTDICKLFYTDATGTWLNTAITQYNNTQFDSGTGLSTLTDGNYAVNWIFRMIGNSKEIVVFLSNGDYDLNTANASQLPNNIPAGISSTGMLLGRIIVQKGADIATQIDNAFTSKFAPSIITSHNGLTELFGGNASLGNYYHSDQPINTDDDVEFNSIKNTTLIRDSVNATKQAQFDTSNITSNNIRVYDFPDVSGTIAVGLNNVTNHEQIRRNEFGVADGVATLDNSGKLNTSQIPDAILGGLNFQSLWNANTNTPAIPTASTLNKGWYYKVNTAGNTLIDGISDWTIGDWIVSNGTIWDKVDAYEAVTSVSGKTGDVTLAKGDVGLGNVTNDAQLKKIANNVSGNIVTWSGTTGDTVADSGKSLPSGDIVGTTDTQTLSNKTLTLPIVGGITKAQRLALVAVEGMEVYQTDASKGKYVYNGTRWDKISNLAYLKASNVVAVNPAANTLLNFSSGVVSNGIKTNMGGGRYELYPGVFELMGIQLLNENDMGISYQFYNYTTSSYIGEKGNASDVVGSAGTGSPAFAILECTVDTQIGLRCTNDSATVTATEGNWLKIVQIS